MTYSEEFKPGDYVRYYSHQHKDYRSGYVHRTQRMPGDIDRVYVFFNGLDNMPSYTNVNNLSLAFDPAKNPHDLHPIK